MLSFIFISSLCAGDPRTFTDQLFSASVTVKHTAIPLCYFFKKREVSRNSKVTSIQHNTVHFYSSIRKLLSRIVSFKFCIQSPIERLRHYKLKKHLAYKGIKRESIIRLLLKKKISF